ncbi:hypothetical protein [Micromonospora chalcea]|uniref:hypothetical protein n=1 Tax=Micromonospora chalcea TaxID=1874 RepID=UPI00157CA184|nr:hypothetical protein [Micromonospora chalcea]
MRFARTIAGMVLLALGVPVLLAGAGLWLAARHADPDGGFGARFEPVRTSARAVLVTDVDALLRTDLPVARTGQTRLHLTARDDHGPVFLGLAPADQVRRWLADVPHTTVRRVAVTRGPLPVDLDPATAGDGVAVPLAQPFWVREGIGSLEWSPAELSDRSLSLVVMRVDGADGLDLRMRGELRAGWFPGLEWALLTGGTLLVVLAVVVLLRPLRPREVVFVVEPDQVPVLAGRLGVTSLSGLGRQPGPASRPERHLVAVGSGVGGRTRAAIAPPPGRCPDDQD